MSLTQARFTSHLRTWLLVAALSGLLIAIGAAIGGGFLYIMVAVNALMIIASFWFSDKFAIMSSRAKEVSEAEAPDLHRMVTELAGIAGVPKPRVFLIPSDQPNAFASGRSPKHAVVAVTEGLLKYMPTEQVRGVMAHEFAHIKNRDILVMGIAATISGIISAIGNIAQFALIFGGFGRSDEDRNPMAELAIAIVAPIAAMLLQLAVSRQREYLADATAAEMLGTGKPLADALGTLERGVQAVPMQVNPSTASLFIVHPFKAGGVANLFQTHPPLSERIRRLEAMDSRRGIHY